jgi:RNA polymerase sigma factor (sigma-70 family)
MPVGNEEAMRMKAATRNLQTLFSVGRLGALSDGGLLEQFAAQQEEATFETLVWRHGSMVWGVCRRVLRNHHDAEDAFQATFLVLARKGHSIAHRELIANWLYGVAYQTALKARSTRAKRRIREGQTTNMPEPEAVSLAMLDDRTELLDRELSRLPEKFRIPIVLCELEGKSHREAAEQLGWPIGTVSGRLSRAKAMLARRLSRQGVSLAAGSLAVLMAQDAASASMPTNLIASTAHAASLVMAGQAATAGAVSAKVSALTKGSLKAMSLGKVKRVTLVLLALAGAGAGIWQTRTRAEVTAPLESGFRSTVHELMKDASLIVTQIEVETLPGASVEVVADKPGRGGGGVFNLAPGKPGGLAHTEVTIFADHVEWKAGSTNVLKFIMSIKGGAAFSSMSDTGPMPEAKRLADVLTVTIESGEYKYGMATKLATYKDVTYSLVVKKPR